jgi:uncharacterized protein (DUF427 family)
MVTHRTDYWHLCKIQEELIMSLTLSHGPLSGKPADSNYHIEGPAHRLFFEKFPRRVRALFGGQPVFDTRRGKLLHETGIVPQLYVQREDVRFDMLQGTQRSTHCPFKGDAAYWSVRSRDRIAENAVWGYPEPREGARWLHDYVAFYWNAMDAWFDEDEEIQGHLRDPYHRVDVRDTSRHVRVIASGKMVAETARSKVVSETGLPNRFYIPPEDTRCDLLEPSATHMICPYKGIASYKTLRVRERPITDAAWFYPEPLEDAAKVRGYICFLAKGVTFEVD